MGRYAATYVYVGFLNNHSNKFYKIGLILCFDGYVEVFCDLVGFVAVQLYQVLYVLIFAILSDSQNNYMLWNFDYRLLSTKLDHQG